MEVCDLPESLMLLDLILMLYLDSEPIQNVN